LEHSYSPLELAERQCKSTNESTGDLDKYDGYNCDLCRNKGYISYPKEEIWRDGTKHYGEMTYDCKCMKIRNSIRRMKASGLEHIISKCTFDKYEVTEDWQKVLKDKAMEFVANVDSLEHKWFFAGGAIGCGKTHLCTAIVREFLHKGKEARYMLWMDESAKLKAAATDEYKRSAMIEGLKNVDVLYIDDFFKIVRGQGGDELPPTAADIKLAYEILNYRYNNPKLITIISSERHVAEIEAIDSAVGSRIYEKTKGNACNIARKPERNYRMRDMQTI